MYSPLMSAPSWFSDKMDRFLRETAATIAPAKTQTTWGISMIGDAMSERMEGYEVKMSSTKKYSFMNMQSMSLSGGEVAQLVRVPAGDIQVMKALGSNILTSWFLCLRFALTCLKAVSVIIAA